MAGGFLDGFSEEISDFSPDEGAICLLSTSKFEYPCITDLSRHIIRREDYHHEMLYYNIIEE